MASRIVRQHHLISRHTPRVARDLLGKFVVVEGSFGRRAYMITEVEAYHGPQDKASHAHRGKTKRNAPMFGEPGVWYAYLVYGMHWMLNIVTGPVEYPAAVLIRGISGVSGPGKVAKVLQVSGAQSGVHALPENALWIEDRGVGISSSLIQATNRIGVSYAEEWEHKPYRFVLKNNVPMWRAAEEQLLRGGVAVIPTDTIYGVVASALSRSAVEKVYHVRGRSPNKPCIVLISSLRDVELFGVTISAQDRDVLRKVWPAPVSVLLPCQGKKLQYLHRGTQRLAFRMPADAALRAFLQKTGPLIAPSANTEGGIPATTVASAIEYFGDKVSAYVDGGALKGLPSTLISLDDGRTSVIRQGAYRV